MDCFIIMPISTPEDLVDRYSGDKNHFKHVLECLFIPAIEKVGMNPVPPIAQGSDVIHAEIIKHLESDDFVLCDMSALNPNVFFELGIRTVVNKPIVLVKDDKTTHIPFDMNLINNHTYLSTLEAWTVDKEIDKLAKHLKACIDRVESGNTLWNYFSLSSQATPLKPETGLDGKVDLLTMQIDALRREVQRAISSKSELKSTDVMGFLDLQEAYDQLYKDSEEIGQAYGVEVIGKGFDKRGMYLISKEPIPKGLQEAFSTMAVKRGLQLGFKSEGDTDVTYLW